MINFTNLNKSRMSAYSPNWQEAIMIRVNAEYQEKAIATSETIRKEFTALLPRIQEGYYATAFNGILRTIPRYAYIKNIIDDNGNSYEAEIDLALHTVSFIEG